MDGQEIAPAFSALPTSLWDVFSMEAGANAIEVRKHTIIPIIHPSFET